MFDLDEQERRIARILGEGGIPKVNNKTLKIYLAYLKKNLEFPCYLTGMEDFSWEERYIFGHGSKTEYEELKKTQPSYKDTFELLGFDDAVEEDGIFANVKRVSDKKEFTLPLFELKATDEKSNNYQLLDDFSLWFVNYR
jgi:hypothetical protein